MKSTLTSVMLVSLCTLSACSQHHTQHTTGSADHRVTSSLDLTYKAFGNEPSWMVDIKANNTLIFSTPESKSLTLRAERSAYAKGIEYIGNHEGQPYTLNINGKACNDTMADKSYDMTATFDFAGQTYTGCASSK